MQEADALCSRPAIMVQGSIRTSGTPETLKNIYGGGLVATLSVDSKKVQDTEEFSKQLACKLHPDAACVYQDKRNDTDLFKYVLPSTVPWSHMFSTLNAEAHNLQDFTLAQKSLEDVFVQLAELQEDPTEFH